MSVMSYKCIYNSYPFINNRSIGYLGEFRYSFSGECRDHHASYPDNLISLISFINITVCSSFIPFIEEEVFREPTCGGVSNFFKGFRSLNRAFMSLSFVEQCKYFILRKACNFEWGGKVIEDFFFICFGFSDLGLKAHIKMRALPSLSHCIFHTFNNTKTCRR